MGILFSSFDAKVFVQLEDASRKYVVYCSKCRRRLLPLGCQSIPKERLEYGILLQNSFIRCVWCDKKVEVVGNTVRWDGALPSKESAAPAGMRPLAIAVCGLYQKSVDRAICSLAEALRDGPEWTLQRLPVRRSTLRHGPVGLNSPTDILFVVHRVSGARTPLTDDSGLYTQFLEKAWDMCSAVVLLLLDVSFGYLRRLLEEQPTLQWLMIRRRFVPVFVYSLADPKEIGDEEEDDGADPVGVAAEEECSWFPGLIQHICSEQPKKNPLVLGMPVPDGLSLSSPEDLLRSWLPPVS
eukprot:GEMP01079509.1.p1 GENE.GEMP01079509.1~~GEMP01079509.1.p1  ORF type:complete len:296 (+),score=34.84 GEMP01079509.1:163-1050(+)